MEKQKELLEIVDNAITGTEGFIKSSKEMIGYGEIILKSIKDFRGLLSGTEAKRTSSKPVSKSKIYSKEDVRAILSEKSAADHGKEVKALLLTHGADKLSTLAPESYEAVIEEAQVIGNE